MLKVFWLAVQGLYTPIAISTLIALFIAAVLKTLIRVKGDGAMEYKLKNFVSIGLDIFYIMSANLAGGALLAKLL